MMRISDIEAEIAAARAELEHTLNSIEDKLSVPKQVKKLGNKAKSKYQDNPVPWWIGVAVAAVAGGALILLAMRKK